MSCQTIPDTIEARWEEIRSRKTTQPAIWAPNGRVLRTFAEVETEARFLQSWLQQIPKKSVVALDLENHPSWPALVLAAFRSQHILLPLDASAMEKTKHQVEALCGAAVRIIATSEEQIDWRNLSHHPLEWKDPQPDFLKISSGTGNGGSRAIRFTKNQLLADCDQICQTMRIDSQDLQYGIIPFSHSYGFSSLVTPLLWQGVPFVVAQDRLPHAIAAGIHSTHATVLPAIPSLFQLLSNVTHLPLRLCISAGAPLRATTAKAFYEQHRLKIHSFYGSSECGGICYDSTEDPFPPEGTVGEPLQGVSVQWANPHIKVHSKAVGLGYHPHEPEETSLSQGYFLPADLLEKCTHGFRLIGRTNDWINVGAKKVHPAEIEADLLRYPAVNDAVVFGVEAGGRGHQIHAVVVTEENLSIERLQRHCGENLSPWKIPRYFHFVRSLPTNCRGKINRRELAKRFITEDL